MNQPGWGPQQQGPYAPQGYYPAQRPPPKKGMSGCVLALLIIGGLCALGFGGCVVCAGLAGHSASSTMLPADTGSATPASPSAVPSGSASGGVLGASPERLERGHPRFFAAVAQLAKNPHAAPPTSEKDETFQDVPYTFYTYGHRPLDIPIDGIELHVRKSNHGAWMLIVRPDNDPGLFTDDFAPPGGTISLGVDSQPSGASLNEMLKATTLNFSVRTGPLSGCVLFLFGDKTFTLKSHSEAYPHG